MAIVTGLAAGCSRADPRIPAGYPRAYAQTLDAADREGNLIIWSSVDSTKVAPILALFRSAHPRVAVRYLEIPAQALNARFLAASAHHAMVPDILWSSAMGLQIKLSNDGLAQAYASPEASRLPDWANWKNEAWGITAEPIVMIYNRRLVAEAAMPRTHAALTTYLERSAGRPDARVATYDLPRSAVGYLYLTQDQQATHDIWRLARAIGASRPRLYPNAEQVLQAVARGDAAIGYNMVGSYALDQVRRDPALGMVLPRDYTLVMSRIALIPAAAPHPAGARLFIDTLLSRAGQAALARQSMPPVRGDVAGPAALRRADAPLRAIRVGPGLLVAQDQLTRRYILRRWNAAMAPR